MYPYIQYIIKKEGRHDKNKKGQTWQRCSHIDVMSFSFCTIEVSPSPCIGLRCWGMSSSPTPPKAGLHSFVGWSAVTFVRLAQLKEVIVECGRWCAVRAGTSRCVLIHSGISPSQSPRIRVGARFRCVIPHIRTKARPATGMVGPNVVRSRRMGWCFLHYARAACLQARVMRVAGGMCRRGRLGLIDRSDAGCLAAGER